MLSYKPKPDCPPIPASLLADWFIEIHNDWWHQAGQTLYGREAEMKAMLQSYVRGSIPTASMSTDEYYVAVKFEEFLIGCFNHVDGKRR